MEFRWNATYKARCATKSNGLRQHDAAGHIHDRPLAVLHYTADRRIGTADRCIGCSIDGEIDILRLHSIRRKTRFISPKFCALPHFFLPPRKFHISRKISKYLT